MLGSGAACGPIKTAGRSRPHRDHWPAKTKGTFTGVEPLEGGNFQLFMRLAMQLDRPGKSFSPPLAEDDSTLPEAPMVIAPLTRALLGALAARDSSAGCQHLRFTIDWFWATTPWISP